MHLSPGERKKILRHHAFASSQDVAEITEPLKKYLNIDYFMYHRDIIDLEKRRRTDLSLLCNDYKALEYMVFDGRNSHVDFYTLNKKDYYFPETIYPEQLEKLAKNCHVHNAFTRQMRLSENEWECVSFATKDSDRKYLNYYLNNRDLFDKFIDYFRDKAAKLINESITNKTNHVIPIDYFSGNECISTDNCCEDFLQSIAPKHFILADKTGQKIMVPQSEMRCLELLQHGRTIKEIAVNLDISPRTVETNLNRSKARLKCYTKKELLDILESK